VHATRGKIVRAEPVAALYEQGRIKHMAALPTLEDQLEQAVAAYRAALEEFTRERAPLQWARTQLNLASALRMLGERESDTARLEEAVAAFEACLTVIETSWPEEWVQPVRLHRDETQTEIIRNQVRRQKISPSA
jgi:hypothetical protein